MDKMIDLYRIRGMKIAKRKAPETTYPLRAAARLTGLSPELLRAWERRHAVVQPLRTPGGTRRYRRADLEKLRLVKAAVDAGHRIGEVACMDLAELRRSTAVAKPRPTDQLDETLTSLRNLEAAKLQGQLSIQLSALGPARFAREVVMPLMYEIGERWANGQMGIAQEHLGSGVLTSLLGSALQPTAASILGPRIVFGTPTGERHELGLRMAAITALGAGANPIYLGAELPAEDLLGAVEATESAVLALSLVTLPTVQAERTVRALRGGLASEVHLWLGGVGATGLELPQGVERIESLEDLEQRVILLGLASAP
jgi:DNA-binding transcriptional MerR regulator